MEKPWYMPSQLASSTTAVSSTLNKDVKMKTLMKVLPAILLIAVLMPAHMIMAQDDLVQIAQNHTGKSTITTQNGGTKYQIEFEGDIRPSDNDLDIQGISPGGYLEITKSVFGSKRRVRIESDSNGKLSKKYYVGWSEKDFATEGREWLAEVLPEVFRTTTLGMRYRVDRFYKKGGATAVIAEIKAMPHNYIQAKYLEELMTRNLSSGEKVLALNLAVDVLDSDHYMAEFLKAGTAAFLAEESTSNAYINAVKSIGSDYYIAEVLKEAMKKQHLATEKPSVIMEIADGMNSDYYLAEIVEQLIRSDIKEPARLAQVVNLSRKIHSDHYLNQVLTSLINRYEISGEVQKAVNQILFTINTDFYVSDIIKKLMQKNAYADVNLKELLTTAGSEINSEFYLSEVLREVIRNQQLTQNNFDSFVQATNRVNSDFYQAEVFKELAKMHKFTEAQLVKTLYASTGIRSDFYLSEALIALSQRVNSSGEKAKAAYREAASSIESSVYYGSAIRAVK